jgi:hypothetical protein
VLGEGLASGEVAHYLPLLFAGCFYVVLALAALALERRSFLRTARAVDRGGPWRQVGVIETSGDGAAFARFNGWLGGVSVRCNSFRLRTDTTTLEVPSGAGLALPVPTWTSRARAGEVRPVLGAGDRVTVCGFVVPPGDGPFRRQSRPIPGSAGLTVSTGASHSAWRDIALLSWGPTALYLCIVAIVAIPALLSFAGQ